MMPRISASLEMSIRWLKKEAGLPGLV